MPNFTMLAQNTDVDYVQQACLAAMSIRATNYDSKICLITNNSVPDKYHSLFTDIVEIPWGDHAANEEWKVSNRWKIIHATPYDETFVLDTDMLVLDNLDHWWKNCQTKDLYYTSRVKNYKDEIVSSRYYRRAFDKFNLPNIYSGVHYFKKNENTFYFYKWLEYALNNWEKFQGDFAGGKFYQKVASVDLSTSIITKILGLELDITNDSTTYPTFTHMKLHCQNWQDVKADRWQDIVGVYLNDSLELKIGNFRQRGIFHYTEDDFVTDNIIQTYEKGIGI